MSSVDRVQRFLRDKGLDIEVVQLESQSTRTAKLAAAAVNAPLGSIVKSLIFLADGQPILVLVAGDRRASPAKLKALLSARRVMIADADTVRRATGFAIGGVPPVAHDPPLRTVIDASLGRFQTLYAAAGAPNALFPIGYEALVRVTAGQVADITESVSEKREG
ncbi:MAG: YbaK/EbsC family protein [Chloroflexi bacterium]|nr:MAG: YbaK/EbsC family protein [Chloroflexota bacterium]